MTQAQVPSSQSLESYSLTLHQHESDPSLGIWLEGNKANKDAHTVTCKFEPSSTLEELMTFMSDRPTFFEYPGFRPDNTAKIRFDHITGLLILQPPRGPAYKFDILDEESLARFIRRVKAFTPIPPSQVQPMLPGLLPEVTEEDLRTKRQIYLTPMAADGVQAPTKTNPSRYLARKADIDNIMLGLLGEL